MRSTSTLGTVWSPPQARLRDRTRSQGIELAGSTPEQFSAFLKADIAKWTQVIREFKITID